MYEGIDTVVLHDELAIEDDLPFLWRPVPLPLAPATQARYSESNVRLLQVSMALDDQLPAEKSDDTAPQAVELARLDLKMNLLLDLVGRLLQQNQPRPAPAILRFNARGASWQASSGVMRSGEPQLQETGLFELYLHDCLIDPLRLTGRVSSVQKGRVEVQFDRGSDPIANLIDKFTFRRHRRRIADARNPKK